MMSTLHEFQRRLEILTKGASEQVLAASSFVMGLDGSNRPLNEVDRKAVLDRVETLASAGARVLAIAVRPFAHKLEDLQGSEQEMVLVGLAVLADPLREEAASAVRKIIEAGVDLVMVTGDHAGTAVTVSRSAGQTEGDGKVLTGSGLRSDGLPADLDSIRVYARVDPEQKLQLVDAFQRAGHAVAVTGDGVNDAPGAATSRPRRRDGQGREPCRPGGGRPRHHRR